MPSSFLNFSFHKKQQKISKLGWKENSNCNFANLEGKRGRTRNMEKGKKG